MEALFSSFLVVFLAEMGDKTQLLVLAFANGRKRPDETTAKYRRYYHGKKATFTIDDEGVQMHLEGQKNYARSKFKEIYGLFDTDMCFYFVIKGKAYYILPKASVEDPGPNELKKYMEKKCGKRFLHYDTNNGGRCCAPRSMS